MDVPPRSTPAELRLHWAAVRRVAHALARDTAEAEDVAQDAWLAALRRPDAPRGSLLAWTRGAARHLSALRSRTDARRRARERGVARAEAQPSAAERAAALEVAELLVARVRALPEAQAEAIWLRFWEDLPPRAIAERLGLGVEAVKTRLKRGLATLRDDLDARAPGGRDAWLGALAVSSLRGTPTAAATLAPGWTLVLPMKKLALALVAAAAMVGAFLSLELGGSPSAPPAPRTTSETARLDEEPGAVRDAALETPGARTAQTPAVANVPRLRVRVVREAGQPLAGALVAVRRREGLDLAEVGRWLRADARGVAEFFDVAAGAVRVVSDRGPGVDADLADGETTEVELAVPPGVRVAGTVVDPAGRPVPNAEVTLQRQRMVWRWTDLAVVATTDGAGRFELPDVLPTASLGARAAGFAPTDLEDLSYRALAAGDELELTLRLEGGGGTLRGIVQDRRGAPVAHAAVWVAEERALGAGADPRALPTGVAHRTADDGTFEIAGLSQGMAWVQVAAPGHGRTVVRVPVEAEVARPTTFRMPDAGGIDGRVLDARGEAIEGATVHVLEAGGTSLERYRPLGFAAPRTDEDGRFRLEDLPPGSTEVDVRVDGSGTASAEVVVREGARETLEVRLTGSLALHGRARRADGGPLAGGTVYAQGPDDWSAGTRTAPDGTYRLEHVPAGPLSVHFYPEDHSLPALTREGVRAEDSPVELVWDAPATGALEGRFVDAAEWIAPGDRVVVRLRRGESFSREQEIGLGDGRFRFEDVPAGPPGHRVTVEARDHVVLASETFDVPAGKTLTLPELRTEAPAALHLTLVTGSAPEWAFARLTDPRRGLGYVLSVQDGVFAHDRLPAGDWWLTLSAKGFAAEGFAVHLAPGETWERTHACVPVAETTLRFEFPRETPRFDLRAHAADGALVLDLGVMRGGGRPPEVSVALLPGTYRLEVTDRTWTGTTEVVIPPEVAEGEPRAVTVRFDE